MYRHNASGLQVSGRFFYQDPLTEYELFINAITEQVSGEDEIWVVESGKRNQINIWKPADG